MNAITSKCLVAGIAIVLVLVQHGLYVSSQALIEDLPQPIWLVVNSIEVVVLLIAGRMLMEKHKTIAIIVGIIGICLAVSVIFSNFLTVFTLGNEYWIPMSTLLIFGLILSTVYLVKG